ncbi:MAG: hypothetical protein IT383_01115 [Deltaproteobacteria bacterium]|nr:hypothetical protein [Deltaproteobacteria bacterium]
MALAYLRDHWHLLRGDLFADIDARAFTSPERRAYYIALRTYAHGGDRPEPPKEIPSLPGPDDSSEVWQVWHAGAARAVRIAAKRILRVAAAWLEVPTGDGIATLDFAVRLAMERLAAAWGQAPRRAADVVRTARLGASLEVPFPALRRGVGGIPFGTLVFLRGERGLGRVSPSTRWAMATARQGLATALWGRRLTEARVADDLVALGAGVELRALRSGALTDGEWSAVAHARNDLALLPLVTAGGESPLQLGRLYLHLHHWRCDGEPVSVVVLDGAEHLDIKPRDLFVAARMMGKRLCHPGYLVVVGDAGSPYESVADLVVDGADLDAETAATPTARAR